MPHAIHSFIMTCTSFCQQFLPEGRDNVMGMLQGYKKVLESQAAIHFPSVYVTILRSWLIDNELVVRLNPAIAKWTPNYQLLITTQCKTSVDIEHFMADKYHQVFLSSIEKSWLTALFFYKTCMINYQPEEIISVFFFTISK